MCTFLDSRNQIVFDECHRAKNLCPVGSSKPTKTGLTVLQLQNKLPKARIIYASATGGYISNCVSYSVSKCTRKERGGGGRVCPSVALEQALLQYSPLLVCVHIHVLHKAILSLSFLLKFMYKISLLSTLTICVRF